MRPPDKLHEALMLFTSEAYLRAAINDGTTKDPLHRKIVSALNGYRTFRRFDDAEHRITTALGKDETLQRIVKREISFVVYALELLRLSVENYKFNIGVSRKKLKAGRATFALDMLKLKKLDDAKYKELKEIIDVSVLTAKEYFHFTQNKLEEMMK